MANYEWESVTLGQNPEIQKIASAAAKASELVTTNIGLAKSGLQLAQVFLLATINPKVILLNAIADEIDNFVKYGVKITYNEQVNQLFWPEQNATDQLIPPIITEVEIELESILDSIRE